MGADPKLGLCCFPAQWCVPTAQPLQLVQREEPIAHLMDIAKYLQVHKVPSTHCLADKQGSTLEFPEDGDNPCCCVKQDRNDMPSRLEASSKAANLGLETAVLPVPAVSCMRAFLCAHSDSMLCLYPSSLCGLLPSMFAFV